MALGPQVAVLGPTLARLSELMTEALGSPHEVVSVNMPGGGANTATHRVLTTAEGSRFSIKKSSRGVPQGDEKARLVSDIAELLSVPNHCRSMSFGPVAGFPPFDSDTANLIRWLSVNSVPIGEVLGAIPKESPSFFSQFGEQALFCLVFGIADRGTQNWVWDANTARISIIDEEASFEDTQPGEFSWAFVSFANAQDWKSSPNGYAPARAFKGALSSMQDKLVARELDWTQRMTVHQFATGRIDRAKLWAHKPLDDLYGAFLQTF